MSGIFDTISYVAFSLAGIALIAAIVMWFRFDIAKIAGDLSGRTARKSIAQMREKNEERYRHQHPGSYSSKRSATKKTETIQHSDDLVMEITKKLPQTTAEIKQPATSASLPESQSQSYPVGSSQDQKNKILSRQNLGERGSQSATEVLAYNPVIKESGSSMATRPLTEKFNYSPPGQPKHDIASYDNHNNKEVVVLNNHRNQTRKSSFVYIQDLVLTDTNQVI
ncbi:MAG: hypothetical protein ACOYCB_02250 [Fastidiosipilaceae bacterium]|jgi:hypothetical protein